MSDPRKDIHVLVIPERDRELMGNVSAEHDGNGSYCIM